MIARDRARRENPWELLAIPSLFLLPGIALLLQHDTVRFRQPRARYFPAAITEFSVGQAHFYGWCAVAVAMLLLLVYFYVRRAAVREASEASHFLNLD
jgi:hypothetical protein